MTALLKLLVSPAGRGIRIVAGLVLVAAGLGFVQGPAGIAVAAVGLVPLVAGSVDVCVFAPLFGYAFNGPGTRTRLS